ncbi:MAG TPA: ABC transporter permease [Anaerolineales bacterium]|nr:ABC transporter permease [Anaerolineales bacterium]
MSTQEKSVTPEVIQHYKPPFTFRRFIRTNSAQFGILGVFVALWLIFIVSAPKTFLAPQIYSAFMSSTPFFAIMAIPLTIVVVAKEMDLSFPSIMAMGMVSFFYTYGATGFIHNATIQVTLAILAALATGALIGWLNGFIIVKFGIPSLVVTIGTQFLWSGAALVLTQGANFSLEFIKKTFYYKLFVGKIGPYFPMQMFWLVLITVLGWILLNRHRFGAHVYLIGDNVNSAELMGVNTGRVRIQVFMLVGIVSAFAGILASFFVAYFWPTLGSGFLLQTLASVFLGGTSVLGGTGTILGTFLGAFIIGAIEAATVAVGLTGFWTNFIYGLIIVLSVIMHMYLRKRGE